LKKMLIVDATSFLLAIIFIALLFTGVFNPRELALFFFFVFIGLSLFLPGLIMIIFTRQIFQWQLDTTVYHIWRWKIRGWTDEQMTSTEYQLTTTMWRIAGYIAVVLGSGFFLCGIIGLVYILVNG